MQQMIHPAKGAILANFTLPSSKSIAHRAILLAALAEGVSEITKVDIDDDIRVFTQALNQLGIVTQLNSESRSLIIAGGNGKFPKRQATIWCGDTERMTRFLLAACACTSGLISFNGSAHLRKRSITPLLKVLTLQGAQLVPPDICKMPFTLIGADSLEGGEIIFNNANLSQSISALLMVAPFARSSLNFSFDKLIKKTRIDMTCEMMAEFGVIVHRIHHGHLMVPVPQRYQARDYEVEPDFAFGAYFFAAAALTGGKITIKSTPRSESKQPEIHFLLILEKMGCQVLGNADNLIVIGPKKLVGVEIILAEFSDEFLILAALAAFATTRTRITHQGYLNRKEEERLAAITMELTKLGAVVMSGNNWLEILPSQLTSCAVSTHKQYRIGMALALIGLRIPGLIIDQVQCVNKNYPQFFYMWEKLTSSTNINA